VTAKYSHHKQNDHSKSENEETQDASSNVIHVDTSFTVDKSHVKLEMLAHAARRANAGPASRL
jgi:hypothetical protein